MHLKAEKRSIFLLFSVARAALKAWKWPGRYNVKSFYNFSSGVYNFAQMVECTTVHILNGLSCISKLFGVFSDI